MGYSFKFRRAHNKTSGKKLMQAERNEEILLLRRSGMTYAQIAEKVGISRNWACKVVTRAIAEANAKQLDHASTIAEREWAVTDELIDTFLPLAIEEGDVQAGKLVLSALDRRAKYRGLDTAQRDDGRQGPPALSREQMAKVLFERIAALEHNPQPQEAEDESPQ